MPTIEEIIKKIAGQSGTFIADEVKHLLDQIESDSENFVQEIGRKLKKYFEEYANQKITKLEFQDLVEDLTSLSKIKMASISVEAKVRAETIAKKIREIVIDNLLKLP